MDKVAMGERIREARKRMGWTQKQLADKLHISDSYMTSIEKSNRNISIETLLALSYCLGVSTDYLLKGDIKENVDEISLIWHGITYGRNEQEIKKALKVINEFFEAIDSYK